MGEETSNNRTHREVIEDICPCKGKYCILKEIVLRESRVDDRMLEQIKCIERFKYEESQRQRKDIGWNQANLLWTINGHAKRFAEVYEPWMRNGTLYELVMSSKKEDGL